MLTRFGSQTRRLVHLPLPTHPKLRLKLKTGRHPPCPHNRELRNKRVLIKYLALLHYKNISHSSLTHLLPLPYPTHLTRTRTPNLPPNPPHQPQIPPLILPPPVLGVFVTECGGGAFAGVVEASREEEGKAQIKAVLGGVGTGIECSPTFLRRMGSFACFYQVRHLGMGISFGTLTCARCGG